MASRCVKICNTHCHTAQCNTISVSVLIAEFLLLDKVSRINCSKNSDKTNDMAGF